MTAESIAVATGVVAGLLAALKVLLPYLSKRPKLSAALAALLVVSVVILSSLLISGCRSSIPVIVKNQNFQCSAVVTTESGEVDLQQSDCVRGDGTGEQVESKGGDGDDTLPVEIPLKSSRWGPKALRVPATAGPPPGGPLAMN